MSSSSQERGEWIACQCLIPCLSFGPVTPRMDPLELYSGLKVHGVLILQYINWQTNSSRGSIQFQPLDVYIVEIYGHLIFPDCKKGVRMKFFFVPLQLIQLQYVQPIDIVLTATQIAITHTWTAITITLDDSFNLAYLELTPTRGVPCVCLAS